MSALSRGWAVAVVKLTRDKLCESKDSARRELMHVHLRSPTRTVRSPDSCAQWNGMAAFSIRRRFVATAQ
jgi:hypothetical protein